LSVLGVVGEGLEDRGRGLTTGDGSAKGQQTCAKSLSARGKTHRMKGAVPPFQLI
jgi:hypothetical protein